MFDFGWRMEMNSTIRRITGVAFLVILLLAAGAVRGDDAGSGRSLEDTLLGLQSLARQKNLNFQQMRDLNEAIARLQSQLQKKSLSDEEKEVAGKLKELITLKAESDPRNRRAQLTAARYFSLFGEPFVALGFLRNTQASSAEDIEWPLLACTIYIQLGDYAKAAIYAGAVDKLLSEQTPLALSEPIHVDQVQAYRLYTPYSGGTPKPGDTLILYIEVDGARFRMQQQGMYGCSLDFSLELRDELQNIIERQDNYGRYAPEYNGPIDDLHATIYYRIPQGLEGGNYTLIITCKDTYGDATAETDFVFTLNGKKRLRIPERTAAQVDPLATSELYLQKAKSGDYSDVIDLLDEDLGELGKDPYNLRELSQQELEQNKLKAAEIMLERSKTQGGLLNK